MGLHIKSNEACLKNFNIRKEGNDENRITAGDLKFECTCDGAVVQSLLGADGIPDFWKGDQKEPRYYGLSKMVSWGEFDDCELTFGKIKLHGCHIKSISFKPVAGRMIELDFTAQLRPTHDEINTIVDAVLTKGKLCVDGERDLFDDEPELESRAPAPADDGNHSAAPEKNEAGDDTSKSATQGKPPTKAKAQPKAKAKASTKKNRKDSEQAPV